jgi:hypothetical protein
MRASRTLPAAAAANNKTSSVALDALSQSGSLPFTDAEVNTSHLRHQRRKNPSAELSGADVTPVNHRG